MNLKLAMAATLLAVAPLGAFAQQDEPNQPPKPTMEEVQKFVRTISGDKKNCKPTANSASCKNRWKNDRKALDDLFAKADALRDKLGQTTHGSWTA